LSRKAAEKKNCERGAFRKKTGCSRNGTNEGRVRQRSALQAWRGGGKLPIAKRGFCSEEKIGVYVKGQKKTSPKKKKKGGEEKRCNRGHSDCPRADLLERKGEAI